MAFNLYRLQFSDPLQFYEQMGDPVASTGGAPVPALRSALRHSVSLATFDNQAETVASRLKLRRQFRSLANNTPMKLQGVYLGWDTDPENNGWYMPDQGQLVDLEGSVGLATGVFKVENFVWIVAGRPRTHRRAMWVYLKDLRGGQWSRDYRRLIYLTDFATLSPLAISYFPPGISDPLTTGGNATVPLPLPVGADGGEAFVVKGLLDLARVSFEQAKSSINKGQVVAYDRRGELTGTTSGPGASWEEMYGPDYPYFWMEGGVIDTPVLENGRCRVRYDPSGQPGFRIDVWNVSSWEEQCKVTIGRLAGASPVLDTLLSASLAEYSETRAVIQCVMRASSDPQSREEIFITLQRGWSGPRFEVYTSPTATGEKVDAYLITSLANNDADDSVIKVDTSEAGVASIVATAMGTGHTGKFPISGIGAFTFTGENWVSVGRWGAPYGLLLGVLRASVVPVTVVSEAYGASTFRNAIQIEGSTKDGYLSVHTGFPPMNAQQALEAESMTLASGTTSVADAAASNGKAAQAKRKVEGLHVSQATWPNGHAGVYRVFARVKATSGTLKLRAKTSSTTGAEKTVAASATPAYTWVDLGLVTSVGGTLEVFAWQSVEVNFQVDRVEAFLVEDRSAASAAYLGSRDLGQSILYDSRVFPTIVSRST